MGRHFPRAKSAKRQSTPLSATRRAGDLASLIRSETNGIVPVKAQFPSFAGVSARKARSLAVAVEKVKF
jgi:hypothetical protein